MIVVCYNDGSIPTYGTFTDIDEFKAKDPTAVPNYVFESTSNMYQTNLYEKAHRYGLDPADLMTRFQNRRGETCIITGIEPRNRKYPIIVFNETRQKRYKCPAAAIRKDLGKLA